MIKMGKGVRKIMTSKKTTIVKAQEFDSSTVELIKSQVAVGATDAELQLFLYQALKTGLDPLARQIYFIKRKVKVSKRVLNPQTNTYVTRDEWIEKASIQASIDGFRVVAEKSGLYAGQDEPVFTESSAGGKPSKCVVTVYKFNPKSGERYAAAYGVAYWSEYVPSPPNDFMWNKMPHTMLAKVAEALALRKAFPQDLSGIYSGEEMEQSGLTPTPPATTTTQIKSLPKAVSPEPKPTPVTKPEPGVIETPEQADQLAEDEAAPLPPEDDVAAAAEEIFGAKAQPTSEPAPASAPINGSNSCEGCGKTGLTQAVVDYSKGKFGGKVLCFSCQKKQ